MTLAQIDLLKRLIAADRLFHSRRHAGEQVSQDDRGIEVGWINGVNPRTAQSLVDAGLAETIDLPKNSSTWIFLGCVEPYDSVS